MYPGPENEGLEIENLIMQPLNNISSSSGNSEKKEETNSSDEELYDNLSYVDPRNHTLGMRFITNTQGRRRIF